MDRYLAQVQPLVLSWLAETWPGMANPEVRYVPSGSTGRQPCTDPSSGKASTYDSESLEYCGTDPTIYVGQDELWDLYQQTGTAGPAVALAHEYGHHVQHAKGLPEPRTREEIVDHENQADCLAGAWTGYTDRLGGLDYPEDFDHIDVLFDDLGDVEGPGQVHGTAEQRKDAFIAGFQHGPAGCGVSV
jgi:predicted metalloprotease